VGRLLSTKGKSSSSSLSTVSDAQDTFNQGNTTKLCKPWRSNETFDHFGTTSRTLVDRTYDLEGIANDGYGYTVTISADPSTINKGADGGKLSTQKVDKSKKNLVEGEVGIIANRKTKHRTRLMSSWRQFCTENISNWPFSRPSIEENVTLEVVTRRSLEIRESFEQAASETPYRRDLRNPSFGGSPPRQNSGHENVDLTGMVYIS
jgi:hypothetical protein